MKVEIYDTLPDSAKQIRKEVFMKEQGFHHEFDETDQQAFHLVMFDEDGTSAGTCRIFAAEEAGVCILGRLAVRKKYRGRDIGGMLVGEAERFAAAKGWKTIILHAQCRIERFYEKLGFAAYGVVDDDEGCPHVWMKKQL